MIFISEFIQNSNLLNRFFAFLIIKHSALHCTALQCSTFGNIGAIILTVREVKWSPVCENVHFISECKGCI